MKHYYFPALLLFLSFAAVAQMDVLTNLGQWNDPSLVATGSQNKYNDVWGYVDCNGDEYALLGSREFVHVIGIAGNGTPTEISRIAGTQNVTWRDMKTYGTTAYAVCDGCTEGMLILDLGGLPTQATLHQRTTQWFSKCHNIYIDTQHGRLYAVGTNTRSAGVIVLDIATDPLNPTLLASIDLAGGYVHDIHVENNIAYASHGYGGLYVYDMTNASSPTFLGSITTYNEQGYNHSSWLDPARGILVWADENLNRSVKIADVSDPSDITVTDLFRSTLLAPAATNSIAHNPFIRDNYAIISYYDDGVQIFDITDETNVQQVAGYDTEPGNTSYVASGAWGAYPYLPSQYILGSDQENGLFVLKWQQQTFSAGSAFGAPSPAACALLLPVALLDVSGFATGRGSRLEWITTQEKNADRFEVEFSTDGVHFETVGTIPATGNSDTERHYNFDHPHPVDIPLRYYRLRTVDTDGSADYSKIITVQSAAEETSWAVAPNPAYDQLSVQTDSEDLAARTYEIVDLTGRSYGGGLLTGTRTDIDVRQLPAGAYLLLVRNGKQVWRRRFVRGVK